MYHSNENVILSDKENDDEYLNIVLNKPINIKNKKRSKTTFVTN